MIGGQTGGLIGYAALVAPNGALTVLDLTGVHEINSVAILDAGGATPQAAGPFGAIPYTQLAFSSALESRFIEQNRVWRNSTGNQSLAANISDSESLIAANQIPACKQTQKKHSIF